MNSVGSFMDREQTSAPTQQPHTAPMAPRIGNTNLGEPIIVAGIVVRTNDPMTVEATTHGQYPRRAMNMTNVTIVRAINKVESETVLTTRSKVRMSRVLIVIRTTNLIA